MPWEITQWNWRRLRFWCSDIRMLKVFCSDQLQLKTQESILTLSKQSGWDQIMTTNLVCSSYPNGISNEFAGPAALRYVDVTKHSLFISLSHSLPNTKWHVQMLNYQTKDRMRLSKWIPEEEKKTCKFIAQCSVYSKWRCREETSPGVALNPYWQLGRHQLQPLC